VLVATDIAAPRPSTSKRSATWWNLDVPAAPEDYIHRVGRTARAELKGERSRLVSPDEENDLRISNAPQQAAAAREVPDFDYRRNQRATRDPIADVSQNIARTGGDRMRAAENAKRRGNGRPPVVERRGPSVRAPGRRQGRRPRTLTHARLRALFMPAAIGALLVRPGCRACATCFPVPRDLSA